MSVRGSMLIFVIISWLKFISFVWKTRSKILIGQGNQFYGPINSKDEIEKVHAMLEYDSLKRGSKDMIQKN